MSQIMRRCLNITTVYIISRGIKKASMNAESHLNLNVLLEYFPEVDIETFQVRKPFPDVKSLLILQAGSYPSSTST